MKGYIMKFTKGNLKKMLKKNNLIVLFTKKNES